MADPTQQDYTLTYRPEQGLDEGYADRLLANDEARWQRLIRGEETLTVGTPEQATTEGAAGAAKMPAPPPLGGTPEQQQQIQALLADRPLRDGLDKTFRTFFGASLDEVQQAITTGTLPDKILSLRLLDPISNLIEGMVKDQALKDGLDPTLAAKIASGAALMLGVMLPGPGGFAAKGGKAGKAAKEVGEALLKPSTEIADALAAGAQQQARVNLLRINATEAVKETIEDLNQLNAPRLAVHRARVGHEATIAASQNISLKAALAFDAETILLNKDQATGLRDLYNTAATHLESLLKQAKAPGGSPEAEAKLWASFAVAAKLAELDEANARNIARALEARKIPSEAARAARRFQPEDLAAMARTFEGVANLDAEQLARRLDMLSNPQRKLFLAQVRQVPNAFHELWINMLLTNPVTHAANVTGTAAVTLWDLPETAVAGLLRNLYGGPDGVSLWETSAKVRGLAEGLGDGFRLARRAIVEGGEVFGQGKVEHVPAISATAFGWEATGMPGRTLDVLGEAARIPTRALKAEDAFFKGINYRMELKALATRAAAAQGLRGKAFAEAVGAMEAAPDASMIAAAVDGAMLRTLNADLGEAGRAFMHWVNKVPGGRVILPFIRTPTNAAKWTWQRAPVLNLLSAQNWSDALAGGAARDKALARVAIGNAVGLVIAYEVAQGTITGGGSTDPNIRRFQRDPAVGERPPYSIKVGDTWYQYSRTDPIGSLIGTVADFAEIRSQMPADQDLVDEWAGIGEAIALAAGHTMVNKTYMLGLANVLEAVKNPDRSAGKVAEGWARSLVPAGVRQLTRQRDDRIVRDARGVVDGFKAGLPFFADGLPPERNPITGEPLTYPPGWGPDMVSPIFITKQGDDAVFQEILANRISITPIPRTIGGQPPPEGPRMQEARTKEGIRLTPQERDFWIVQMTQGVTDGRGRTLHEALADLVASDSYQRQSRGPEGGRSVLIRATYQAFRDRAEAVLRDPDRGSPNLERDLRARLEQRVESQLPIDNPRSPQNPANQVPAAGNVLQRLFLGR